MNQHPITPSDQQIDKWESELLDHNVEPFIVLERAFQAGADQELEACCSVLELSDKNAREFLYSARRPESPSLKEQALAELAEWENIMDIAPDSPIRRALEQLPE